SNLLNWQWKRTGILKSLSGKITNKKLIRTHFHQLIHKIKLLRCLCNRTIFYLKNSSLLDVFFNCLILKRIFSAFQLGNLLKPASNLVFLRVKRYLSTKLFTIFVDRLKTSL